MNDLAAHYDQLAPERDRYLERHRYYYSLLYDQYRYFVSPHKRVLEVGCGTGSLLHCLKPSYGLGVDISAEMINAARQEYPHLEFYTGDINSFPREEKFDYIILSGLIGELENIQEFFHALRRFCHSDTRIIIEYYSYLWQYILKGAERLKLKIPQRIQNWITAGDIENFLKLSDYEVIKKERCILFPLRLGPLSHVINRYLAKLPVINALTLNHFIVARPLLHEEREYSVTIVVPCRNEKGNVEQVITRTAAFGSHQEFIFVEGHSQDGTYQEIERVISQYPQRNISLYKQTEQGKADAVRLGFSKARNDVLMILDGDLTVAPEELPKFYEAIRTSKGEFINGCRLIYPMEKEAMRFLNLAANKMFGLFFSWLLGERFKDTLCGTKVLFRRHYEEIAKNRPYFGDWDPFGDFDLIFGATKLNLKIIELPVRYKERQYGRTQIKRFQHGLLLLRMCFLAMRKIKFR